MAEVPTQSPPGRDPSQEDESITVDIFDQTYRLRGPDPEYIHRLAAVVDAKMRLVAAQGKTVDSLRVAVLAALNIADELVRATDEIALLKDELEDQKDTAGTLTQTQTSLHRRAHSLSGLLDSVLTEDRRIG